MRRKVFRTIWKAKTPKNVVFWKIDLKKAVWKLLKNYIFEGVFAFHIVLKNFLRIQWPCSRYLEGAPGSYLYAHTKIGTVRRTNQKICTEKQKKNVFFEKSTSKKRLEICKKQCFLRWFCFSDHSKKFTTHAMTMFKISRKCP